jgi:hypothetical protein
MKTLAQPSFAERIGRTLGRMWRAALRFDHKAHGALVAHGMNANLAAGILWVLRIALLGIVLYGAFWVALLLAFAYTGAWMARNTDWERKDDLEPEWRNGTAGFGLYTYDEYRIDPHVFDED